MKYKIKEANGRYYPMVKKKWYLPFQYLGRWWGRYIVDRLTDCRIITCPKWQVSGCLERKHAEEIISMAKAQPVLYDFSSQGITPNWKDGFQHFDPITGNLVSI